MADLLFRSVKKTPLADAEMTSREELLALAAQLDAEGASQHVLYQDDGAPEQASEAAERRRRACELVRANEAPRLLGLVAPRTSSPTSSSTAAAPPWPRSEVPVLPPPKSLKRSAPTPKVPRAVRNGVVARLAAEHALLLAAAEPAPSAAPKSDPPASSASASASSASASLTSLLVEAVRSSGSLRRAAAALALKQEEASVFGPSSGKETYLSRARATTALSARTSAAEVSAALRLAKRKKCGGGGGGGDGGSDEEGGGSAEEEKGEKGEKGEKKKRNAAPDPNPTPLPLLRREEQMERERKEQRKEREARREQPPPPPQLPPPPQSLPLPLPLPELEEEPIDWEAAAAASEPQPQREQQQQQPRAAAAAAAAAPLPSPRSAISAVVSVALAPFVENRQVSREAADSAAARAVSKVLGSFLVSPLAARAEKEEKRRKGGGEKALNAAVAAFLTDSQRGKIAAFARRCLDAEEERKKKGTK